MASSRLKLRTVTGSPTRLSPGGHPELTEEMSDLLTGALKDFTGGFQTTPFVLSRAGVLVLHTGELSQESASSMARSVVLSADQNPASGDGDDAYVETSLPGDGDELQWTTLFSVPVGNDLTLSMAWDDSEPLPSAQAILLITAAEALDLIIGTLLNERQASTAAASEPSVAGSTLAASQEARPEREDAESSEHVQLQSVRSTDDWLEKAVSEPPEFVSPSEVTDTDTDASLAPSGLLRRLDTPYDIPDSEPADNTQDAPPSLTSSPEDRPAEVLDQIDGGPAKTSLVGTTPVDEDHPEWLAALSLTAQTAPLPPMPAPPSLEPDESTAGPIHLAEEGSPTPETSETELSPAAGREMVLDDLRTAFEVDAENEAAIAPPASATEEAEVAATDLTALEDDIDERLEAIFAGETSTPKSVEVVSEDESVDLTDWPILVPIEDELPPKPEPDTLPAASAPRAAEESVLNSMQEAARPASQAPRAQPLREQVADRQSLAQPLRQTRRTNLSIGATLKDVRVGSPKKARWGVPHAALAVVILVVVSILLIPKRGPTATDQIPEAYRSDSLGFSVVLPEDWQTQTLTSADQFYPDGQAIVAAGDQSALIVELEKIWAGDFLPTTPVFIGVVHSREDQVEIHPAHFVGVLRAREMMSSAAFTLTRNAQIRGSLAAQASFSVTDPDTGNRVVRGQVVALTSLGQEAILIGAAPADQWPDYKPTFEEMVNSVELSRSTSD